MSALRVVWPDEDLDGALAVAEPDILPISRGVRSSRRMDIISRARLLFENRSCPNCHYPVVLPLELDDATINRNGLPIPGTATLVGFHCSGCGDEWSV
jgi:hypothetical protein